MGNNIFTPARLKLRDLPGPARPATLTDAARLTVEALASPSWRRLVDPLLVDIDSDRDRSSRRGPKTLFSSRELESIFLFGWLAGRPSAKDARTALQHSAQARKDLGLDYERGGKRGGSRISNGLPSEPSLSRHRQRIGDERRVKIYEQLVRELTL